MKIFALITIILASAALSSCNTVQGMGEDLEKGGQDIKDAAR